VTSFTKGKTLRITEEIRKYRRDPFNYSDIQIQYKLGLTDRMWFRYNKIVLEQDKKIWLSFTRSHLETEFLKLKYALEETYRIALYEANRKDIAVLDKLECLQVKDDARINVIRLLLDGPGFLKEIEESVRKAERETAIRRHTN
jgi:hypothetical protein